MNIIKQISRNATFGAHAPSAKGTLYDPVPGGFNAVETKRKMMTQIRYPVQLSKGALDKAIEMLHGLPPLENIFVKKHLIKDTRPKKITHGWYQR